MTDGPARTYKTQSGIPLKSSYSAKDIPDWYKADVDISPGQLPYQRGAFAEGYRSKPWRIFQLSGFGKPEDENERIKFLLAQGETGFLMEHDRNTADHMYNVDHPEVLARKEDVGLTGAVMQSVRDMDICLKDLPIETTFGHAGGAVVQHAPFALAGYWTIAKRRGIDLSKLPGTGQSDFFLTYLGCVTKQQIPTAAGLRFNADIIEFCDQHLPRWVPVSIAGYNGADTGLNAYQELGSLFANAVEYLDEIKRRGTIPIESAAKACGGVSFRLSMDIFEEASKIRAARRMWSDLLERRYGITNTKVRQLRVHCVTSGSNMTYQQPMNNLVRGTVMALAGILGGIQSLGVSGYDEALSIPSEHAHQMSLRIQQVLQHETNIVAVTDPLGGSYYVESLTADLIERSWAFFDQIEAQGGFLETLNTGWLHARAHENQLDDFGLQGTGEKIIVGVNDFREDISPFEIDGFRGVNDAFDVATERLADLRRTRAERPAADALKALERACKGTDNIMPVMMDALAADVTVGEIGDIWRNVYGDWATPEITI